MRGLKDIDYILGKLAWMRAERAERLTFYEADIDRLGQCLMVRRHTSAIGTKRTLGATVESWPILPRKGEGRTSCERCIDVEPEGWRPSTKYAAPVSF